MAMTYYKMRAQEQDVPAPGYVTWLSVDSPDFAGLGYATGSPTPTHPMVAGSVVLVSEWGAPSGGSGGGGISATPYACPSGLVLRDVVKMTSADSIDLAQADVPGDWPTVGFVVSKPTPTSAYVQFGGELGGFTGLTAGATYYLSETPGQITTTAPITAGSIVQEVGWARNATTLVIEIERDYVLL